MPLPGGELAGRNIPMMTAYVRIRCSRKLHRRRSALDPLGPVDVTAGSLNTPRTKLPGPCCRTCWPRSLLKIHREQKPMDVFVLVVAKGGPKLQKAESGGAQCQRSVTQGGLCGGNLQEPHHGGIRQAKSDRRLLTSTARWWIRPGSRGRTISSWIGFPELRLTSKAG